MPAELDFDLLATIQTLFEHYTARLEARGFNLLNANGQSAEQSVDHLHFHFLPRFPEDGIKAWPILSSVDFDSVA
ncbi:HIT domain-containing protein [Allorhizobium sp. BGMRC 0089]|nr:HIT domain-containing protein [Allorhizobium sonneratiae]MCM2291133.1 HIT domain-containing protein [Allorhizobium sonneratiae]